MYVCYVLLYFLFDCMEYPPLVSGASVATVSGVIHHGHFRLVDPSVSAAIFWMMKENMAL